MRQAPKLYVPIALPGSGKTTWTRRLLENPPYCVRVSSDDIRDEIHPGVQHVQDLNERVFAEFHDRIALFLAFRRDVIADATNLRDFARQRLRSIADRTDATLHYLVFTNVHQAILRNRGREREVPVSVMVDFVARYEQARHDIPTENYDTLTYIGSVH